MRPKFEERKETMLAYVEHQGPYSEIPWRSYMERLYGWAKEQKVWPGVHTIGIYYDDPKTVPAERCRSDIAITFKGEASGTEEVKVRKLPATKVAALSFKAPGEGMISWSKMGTKVSLLTPVTILSLILIETPSEPHFPRQKAAFNSIFPSRFRFFTSSRKRLMTS